MKNFFEKWEDKDQSFFKKVRLVTQLCIVLLTVVVWCLIDWKYGIIGIFWLINNEFFYAVGCREICIDEWEEGYPCFGVPRMFRSWRFFIPLAGIVCLVIYAAL